MNRRIEKEKPFPDKKYLSFEDTILEANYYGLSFDFILNFTYGEMLRYIEFHREKERHRLQDQCVIAYHQAMLIAGSFINGEHGEVFEHFPYWTEDEILDIRASQAISYFNQFDDS